MNDGTLIRNLPNLPGNDADAGTVIIEKADVTHKAPTEAIAPRTSFSVSDAGVVTQHGPIAGVAATVSSNAFTLTAPPGWIWRGITATPTGATPGMITITGALPTATVTARTFTAAGSGAARAFTATALLQVAP